MLTLNSPAKINLFLRILRRRPDGYHELASLFQTIDLLDTIQISLDDRDSVTCTDPSIPTDDSNLVMKAVQLYRKKTDLPVNVRIHIDKKIPSQAGLGGGSSNAATTLWGINELLKRPATQQQLQTWSSEIGSDIPFFFSDGTAYCTGRGERVLDQPSLKLPTMWIVKPAVGASTPAVYGRLKLDQLQERDPIQSKHEMYIHPEYYNDLEGAAFEVVPQLKQLKANLLASGFTSVLLCGSGSSFFCIGEGNPKQKDCISFHVKQLQRTSKSWY